MKTGLILASFIQDSSANPHSRVRRQGINPSEKGFYGSWDWFIDRIQKDSGITTTKRATTTAPPTSNNFFQRSLRTGNSGFSSGNSRLAQSENQNSYSFKGAKGKQVLGEDIPWFQANQKPEKKFQQLLSDVGKREESPSNNQFSTRSGNGFFKNNGITRFQADGDALVKPKPVQFIDDMGRTALQYNAFEEIGSGDSSEDRPRTTSFSAELPSMYKPDYTAEKPSSSDFTFQTSVERSSYGHGSYNSAIDQYGAYDPNYVPTPVEDNTPIPVSLTQEWPSNPNALGGAIFEVMNFIFGDAGTCYIRLPVAVYWFHVFNAHVDPIGSDPSSGVYALVAANQAFEDFIVNFIGDDYRFGAESIELSCDSTQKWTTSLLSFPGNTNGDKARTNVRAYDGFDGKKVVIQFIYDVEGFYVDDPRVVFEPASGVGNTFTISQIDGTYLEELWFGWNYVPGGWFSAADVLVGYFDDN
ncbi:Oidioi.mRNA.OKI2018_I69.chr1.g3138.t1.cds [Oikopleura dioica]|uniref:Oidioi.mRNA.OKI2018_I69.chr1.g3138.t1.cds n=1 Tax=Oikopleura dioica TaxID=34765 RepID=A0ABN7ST39_OIKDI|nr:Oidioi.mRNA.OKI2018_I69.chr1.g3138.t1.cds [Oikopleura dioica]